MTESTSQPDDTRGELVHYAVEGSRATITLDSPHNRNALSRRLVSELTSRLEAAGGDPGVKVVVIRAEGRTFCSGADLSEAAEGGMQETAAALVDLQRRIVKLPQPVVTVLRGNVRAGGIGIVAASDIALTADDASFAFTEVRLGLAPAAISLTVLPRLTSRSAGLTFLTGEVFDGTAAAAMGLVTSAVPEVELDDRVDAVCAALDRGDPQGLRETKRLVNRQLVDRIGEYGEELSALSATLFASEPAKAAMRAFLNRPPKGRPTSREGSAR